MQDWKTLKESFEKAGQGHVFRFWDDLTEKEQKRFLEQLKKIDLDLINHLVETFIRNPRPRRFDGELEPPQTIPIPKTKAEIARAREAKKIGEEALRSGKVGLILVAGGQGTRLGYPGPKGMFPITPVKNKSLFQWHAEKIRALEKRYGVELPWYIMTSESNDQPTREFFEANNYFGLKASQIVFFVQDMLPAVDKEGRILLDEKGHVFTSPNGHGGTLLALYESGALEDMKRRGVEQLFYFQVDNVLVKIADPIFLGYHIQQNAEMSSKVVPKRDPFEKLGVIGIYNGKLSVVEYSDLSEEDMLARNPDGTLKYNAGSIAIHFFRRDFLEAETEKGFKLPYHVAHKKIPYLDETGRRIEPDAPNGYKFETFIFDALRDTTSSVVMEVVREEEFSPVKNKEGEDSPQTARRDLTDLFGRWLEKAGVKIPRDEFNHVIGAIEISPLFALDEEELIRKIGSRKIVFHEKLYLGDD
ncbi:MAG: UDPGP type 1 family protein [Calditrichaeota bacterium]|nr:UDPGP type 1 family protein [Calditrichota bacterium]